MGKRSPGHIEQLLAFGDELLSERVGVPGFVVGMASGGVGGLLPGVGFGVGDEAELAGDLGWCAGVSAFGFEGAGFELAMGHAVDDGSFGAYFQGADRGQAHVLEFGIAAVRRRATAWSGSVIPAASRYAAAAAARRA